MWSAAMGGLFAMVGNHVFPAAHLSPGAFALVAMGAVFGAAARATFSFIIFAFEITRDYNSVLPLMLAAVIADGIAMLFMPTSSIMTEKLARHEALLILDEAGRLAGIITRGDVLRALDKDASGAETVQEAGSTKLVVTYADELVSEAAAKLLRYDVGRLPVVDRGDERKVVGYLGRAAILAARLLRFHDEHVREPGWLPSRNQRRGKVRHPKV
jgi:CIC family chloride channel protein